MRLFSDDQLGIAGIWAEAEGEPAEGKIAIGEVIRRRARLGYNSDGTIAGTIARRYQFSALNDDPLDNKRLIATLKIDDSDPVVQACADAWRNSAMTNFSNDALLYYNPRAVIQEPAWKSNCILTAVIGHHEFYKPKPGF